MGIDKHTQHTEGFVQLDEAHPTHVGRQVVANIGTLKGTKAGFFVFKVEHQVFDVIEALIPLCLRLFIDGNNLLHTLLAQVCNEMATNKTTRSTNYNFAHYQPRKTKNVKGFPILVARCPDSKKTCEAGADFVDIKVRFGVRSCLNPHGAPNIRVFCKLQCVRHEADCIARVGIESHLVIDNQASRQIFGWNCR